MLCCANGMPPTTDDTEGYFRRFLIILAPNQISESEKDVTLEKKLMADDVRAAIFNWMYDGYRSFVKNGGKIEVAASVKDIVEDMKENSNSLRRWISTNGYWAAPDPENNRAEGWKSYKEWSRLYLDYCKDFGEVPKSISSMTELFKKMKVVKKRRGDGMWYYLERKATEVESAEVKENQKEQVNIVNDDPIEDLNLPF